MAQTQSTNAVQASPQMGQRTAQPYQPAQVSTPEQYQPSYTPPSTGFAGAIPMGAPTSMPAQTSSNAAPQTTLPQQAAPAPAQTQNNYGYNAAQIAGGLQARAPFGINPANGQPFATAEEGAHPYAAYAATPGANSGYEVDPNTGFTTQAGMAKFLQFRADKQAADTARERSFGFSGTNYGPPPNSNPWSWANNPTPGLLK